MTTWNLPTDEHTTEWAELITKDFLGRRGCDEGCRSLAALVSRELVNDALSWSNGPVVLGIESSPSELVISTSAVPAKPRSLDDGAPARVRPFVRSCRRLHDERSGCIETACEVTCVVEDDGPCRHDGTAGAGDASEHAHHAHV